ncbi:thioredoxin family protein [Pseudoneobacillus sp. C159]
MIEYNQEQLKEFLSSNQSGIIYLYTPLCGTCQTASKMLNVVEALLELPFLQVNLNYARDAALSLGIESVPCLLIVNEGRLIEKVYAFHSVPYLYEKLNHWFDAKKVR